MPQPRDRASHKTSGVSPPQLATPHGQRRLLICALIGGTGWPPGAAQGSADTSLAAASGAASGAVACVDMALHPGKLAWPRPQKGRKTGCSSAGLHSTSRGCTASNQEALTLAAAHNSTGHTKARCSSARRSPSCRRAGARSTVGARHWLPPVLGTRTEQSHLRVAQGGLRRHRGTAWTRAIVLHGCRLSRNMQASQSCSFIAMQPG